MDKSNSMPRRQETASKASGTALCVELTGEEGGTCYHAGMQLFGRSGGLLTLSGVSAWDQVTHLGALVILVPEHFCVGTCGCQV